jgi:hypothetical protein
VQPSERHNQLLQIVNDPASTKTEVDEAKHELTDTELPQDEEDHKILAFLNFKAPDGAYRPDYSPACHYDIKLQALCLAVGHEDSCLFLRDHAAAEHHVAVLDALAKRTQSETIRNAAIRCIETARHVWQL